MKRVILVLSGLLFSSWAISQDKADTDPVISELQNQNESLKHRLDVVEKGIDDQLWYDKVGDLAFIDKVSMTGPPLSKEKNPTAQGAGNPFKFWSYVFIPKSVTSGKKYPLIVFAHGGVHGNFNTFYGHIIRELMTQGYIVVAPEYRGSTGYGRSHYRAIDYGGLETEDVYASGQYMVENYDIVDKNRLGIMGWSHGGLITLFNVFDHGDAYKVAYAGVPVSDLVARMGYKTQGYRDLYSADYHIGKSAYEDVKEYQKRSPAWNTAKMKNTPLLIHTNTNDEDVNVLEVQHLIKSLKADGKKFEYEVFEDIPGGHVFDRMDTKTAKEIRLKVYKFLATYLKPASPFNSLAELQKAGYRY